MADELLFVLVVVFIDLLNKLIKYMYTRCNFFLNRKSVNNRNISNRNNNNDSNSVSK